MKKSVLKSILSIVLSLLFCLQLIPAAAAAERVFVWEKIDDKDDRLVYIGSWTHEPSPSDYQGGASYTNNTNNKVTYTFEGKGIRVYCRKQHNTGAIRVKVDKNFQDDIDVYSASGKQFQSCVFEKMFDTSGTHTIEISTQKEYVILDALAVYTDSPTAYAAYLGELIRENENRTPAENYSRETWFPFHRALLNARRVLRDAPQNESLVLEASEKLRSTAQNLKIIAAVWDDRDKSIDYVGNWKTYDDQAFYQGTLHYSDEQSDIKDMSYTFEFTGIGFEIIQRSYYGAIHLNVEVDGNMIAEDVVTSSETDTNQKVVYSNRELGNGTHKVTITGISCLGIEGKGANQFQLDAIRIYTEPGDLVGSAVDKTGLKAQMDAYDALRPENYTEATSSKAREARTGADTVFNNAASQVEIDQAEETLYCALRDLVMTDEAKNATVRVSQRYYATIDEALADSKAGETILLLKDLKQNSVVLSSGVTLDLGGKTLETGYFIAFKGNSVVDSSSEAAGRLKVGENNISLDENNPQMPLYTAEGYQFAKMLVQQTKAQFAEGAEQDKFSVTIKPLYLSKEYSHTVLGDGAADNHLQFRVRLSWTHDNQGDGDGIVTTQEFLFSDELIRNAYSSGKALRLNVHGVRGLTNLSVRTCVVSDTSGVQMLSTDGFAE